MRLKPFLSRALFGVLFVVGLAIANGVRVQTQAPFLMFGSNGGVAQPINATNNAIWVSAQGGNALPTGVATGQVLVSNGVGAAPVYSATPSVTSVIGLGGQTFDLSATDITSLVRGVNFQRLQIYKTFTDATHFERFEIGNTALEGGSGFGLISAKGAAGGNSNQIFIGTDGTGAVNLFTGGSSAQGFSIDAAGNFIDNSAHGVVVGAATGGATAGYVNVTGGYRINGVDVASSQTCSNTAASSDVTGTASKTYFSLNCKVPASSLAAGDTVQFKVRGVYSGNVTDTMTMTVEACQVSGCASGTKVTLATTGALTLTAVTNQGWLIDENLVTFTTGTSGTIDTQGYAQYETASTTAVIDSTPNTTTATVATNVDEYLSVSVTFSSSSGSNHASIRNLIGVIQ